MKNQLYMVRKAVRLACVWTPTGDAKRPLACTWAATKAPQALNTASSTEEPRHESGRMHLCA